ncbi:WYL domain-containing protein [Vibrio natriegens]|uniref:WYL domain-containing protein n=1 Tax=Vibrio natriegens TaxID=691 RepID=UPI003909C994
MLSNTIFYLVTWCETRNEYRNFRVDRVQSFLPLEAKYKRCRQVLLSECETLEEIDHKRFLY